MKQPKSTSWGNVAPWYHNLLKAKSGTFQHDVILPNLLRLVSPKPGQMILDLACGSGFFAREFAAAGAKVVGVDIAKELIAFAKQEVKGVEFFVASADKIPVIKSASIDTITIVLALQNIENMAGVFTECSRVLKPNGQLFLVLNHPTFRVPKESSWGWDEEKNIQYRRIDRYLSEARVKIEMHPGDDPSVHTWSFHRPLQVYVKALAKAGFSVTKLEEWISNRQGPKGRTFSALEQSRKEIPLFLFLGANKK
ncbi:MAG: methyltransferase domain-containing protein [Candidatus Magasanikbacteria bacterium]|nr:methyltransferase domain-containing protein [Candidatus Magasanikbacteria bacterium]